MNKLGPLERVAVVRCLVDGNSMRATARITCVARNTIDKLLVELGNACLNFQDLTLRNLNCKRIQVDECWSFCCSKAKDVRPEHFENGNYASDVWTWAAIDADTKLIPCWELGQRDAGTATHFVADLADRVQLTSDGLGAYLQAVAKAFRGAVDYAMLVKIYNQTSEARKRYSPARCIGCKGEEIVDNPDLERIGTNYIERANLTMRMGRRRFTRLTNGFSRKIENHAAAVALHMMYYNFGRNHITLETSPAVSAGVADHIWSIDEIIGLLELGHYLQSQVK